MKKQILTSLALAILGIHTPVNGQQATEMHGVIEVEAYSSQGESDLTLASTELTLLTRINQVLQAEITLKYEDQITGVDTVLINITPPDSRLFYNLGQMYLPFGEFESHMVTDPLTKALAETRESALLLGYLNEHFTASLYLFNGSNKTDQGAASKVDTFGVHLAYSQQNYALGFAYLNDIGDSDSLQASINTTLGHNNITTHTAGVSMNARLALDNFTVLAEYISAIDEFAIGEFDSIKAQPSAAHLELAYALNLSSNPATIALAAQQSREARAAGLPKKQILAGLGIGLLEQTTLTFELSRETAYDASNNNAITIQFTVEI